MTPITTKRQYPLGLHYLLALALIASVNVSEAARKSAQHPLSQQADPQQPPVFPQNTDAAPAPGLQPPGPAPVPQRPAATAPPPTVSDVPLRPNEVLLNFQGADLSAVVKAVSQMMGKNFLLDPRAKGQITIISSKPISTASAYQVFISALKAQGFATIEGPGNLVKIIPSAEARQYADVNTKDAPPGGGEQMVTHVVIVQNGSATQMIPLLRPLMAPTSNLAAFDAANALVITDYADNVRRMLRIIEKIDQPANSDVNVLPLKYASALDIADMLTRLSLPGSTGGGQPGLPVGVPGVGGGDRFSIVPDLRTNTLLVRTDNPGRVNQLRSLVEKLDVPATTGGNTRVVYLRNADAVKLADVLRGLIAGEARSQAAAASAAPPAAGGGVPGAPRGTTSRGAETSLVQADEATNALIINATDSLYNNLRAVIEKLDVRRAQVYVEALIVEMTADNATQLGFQFAGGKEAGKGTIGGVTNFPAANPSLIGAATGSAAASAAAGVSVSPAAALANSGGLTLAYLGKQITLPDGTVIRSLGALARALETGNLANILSTPNLMTLDNAEAKIIVGQNVPFITGSFAQAAGAVGAVGTVNPFQTIERHDVGLTLKIKPQISEGGTIKLDISQEVSTISPTTVSGASDLITNKRSIDTKVLVDDGQTIVLGGLIQNQTSDNQQAVPFLGRIPFLGALFRYRESTATKTNLMIFLRPIVIRGADDGYAITTNRYEYLRGQAKSQDQQEPEIFDRLSPQRPVAKEKQGTLGPANTTDDTASTSAPAPAAQSAPAAQQQ